MGWVRSGARTRVPTAVLGLAAVAAPLAIASDVADARHHRDVRVHHVHYAHHSERVHHHAHATPLSPAAAPAAVRTAAQLAEAQSIIIVVSDEPGAVVTSSNPAPTKVEPAKSEPAEAEPAAQQAHAPGGWLIQIGAFNGEDEARQHLSEAQLKASTALAAADPFTERVQKGDKALYRARFTGFDRETAEIACKQLKRSHFECMALKN
jgi:D-alanyl-D-alanine carboxypeptidase